MVIKVNGSLSKQLIISKLWKLREVVAMSLEKKVRNGCFNGFTFRSIIHYQIYYSIEVVIAVSLVNSGDNWA